MKNLIIKDLKNIRVIFIFYILTMENVGKFV